MHTQNIPVASHRDADDGTNTTGKKDMLHAYWGMQMMEQIQQKTNISSFAIGYYVS